MLAFIVLVVWSLRVGSTIVSCEVHVPKVEMRCLKNVGRFLVLYPIPREHQYLTVGSAPRNARNRSACHFAHFYSCGNRIIHSYVFYESRSSTFCRDPDAMDNARMIRLYCLNEASITDNKKRGFSFSQSTAVRTRRICKWSVNVKWVGLLVCTRNMELRISKTANVTAVTKELVKFKQMWSVVLHKGFLWSYCCNRGTLNELPMTLAKFSAKGGIISG